MMQIKPGILSENMAFEPVSKTCETCGYVEHLQDSDIFCSLHNVYASSDAYCPDYSKSSLLPVVGLHVSGCVIGCDELGVKYG